MYRVGIHVLVELVFALLPQKKQVTWRKEREKSMLVLTIESVTAMIGDVAKPVLKREAVTVEVKRQAEGAWAEEVQRGLGETVFSTCKSWYRDEKAYNSTLYS